MNPLEPLGYGPEQLYEKRNSPCILLMERMPRTGREKTLILQWLANGFDSDYVI